MTRCKRIVPPALVVAAACALGAPSAQAAFPGVNGELLFMNEPSGNTRVFAVGANGKGQRRLPRSRFDAAQPSVSPDGRRIVFQAFRNGPRPELWVMDANGRNEKRLTRSKLIESEPSWSRDGRKILFQGRTRLGAPADVYVMNSDGKRRRQLTNSPASDEAPQFAPNGRRIVFQTNRTPGAPADFAIWQMSATGTGERSLISLPGIEGEPSFSPTGKRIAFSWQTNGLNDDIYVINADGTGTPARVTNDPAFDFTPVWSPDGRSIAFLSDRDGDQDVYVLRVGGGGPFQVTRNSIRDVQLEWGARRRR